MSDAVGDLEVLAGEYRDLAVQWDAQQENPPLANDLMRRRHHLAKRIRTSAEGRAALEGLLEDPALVVRLSAATDSLAWRSSRAETVLEAIERADGRYAFDAKWTLRSYRAGKLDLDW